MYEVTEYRHDVGQFVPVRDTKNKVLAFDSWREASDVAFGLTLRSNGARVYKVEFRTVRRSKKSKKAG